MPTSYQYIKCGAGLARCDAPGESVPAAAGRAGRGRPRAADQPGAGRTTRPPAARAGRYIINLYKLN